MKTKKCSKCREIKSISEFHKDKYSGDGFVYYCKICRLQPLWASENISKGNKYL